MSRFDEFLKANKHILCAGGEVYVNLSSEFTDGQEYILEELKLLVRNLYPLHINPLDQFVKDYQTLKEYSNLIYLEHNKIEEDMIIAGDIKIQADNSNMLIIDNGN